MEGCETEEEEMGALQTYSSAVLSRQGSRSRCLCDHVLRVEFISLHFNPLAHSLDVAVVMTPLRPLGSSTVDSDKL